MRLCPCRSPLRDRTARRLRHSCPHRGSPQMSSSYSWVALFREQREIGLRLFERSREGRSLREAREIGVDIFVALAERHHLVGVEEGGGGSAIGHAEGIAD